MAGAIVCLWAVGSVLGAAPTAPSASAPPAASLALSEAASMEHAEGEPVANPAGMEAHILPKCVIPSMYSDKYAPCTLQGEPRDCGDKTPSGGTKWMLYGLTAIYLDVKTDKCKFDEIPVYLTSIDGGPKGGHWQLTATDSIYRQRKDMFRVIVSHPHIKGDELWRHAMGFQWSVSWIGVMGKHSGVTHLGHTKWKQSDPRSLYVDLDTVPAAFHDTPFYFTSLLGAKNHWKLTGQHEIYSPQSGSFRVYVRDRNPITPEHANAYGWVVAWAGMQGAQCGISNSANWKKDADTDTWEVQVDTTAAGFTVTPAYVTSLLSMPGDYKQILVNGAGMLFGRDKNHFRLYLDNDKEDSAGLSLSKVHTWHVNYCGFAPAQDCQVTPWAGWNPCSQSCGTGGLRTRARTVTHEPFGKAAKPCPKLMMQQACNTKACPTPAPSPAPTRIPTLAPTPPTVDCAVGDWGSWSACSARCGGGTQNKTRAITTHPTVNGKSCPQLSGSRACNTQQCIGIGASRLCGATTDVDLSRWRPFGSDGLYLDVFTSHCKFAHTPQYVCSVLGDASHWALTGTNAISRETRSKFRVIIIHPKLRDAQLLAEAKKYRWRVSWVADAGQNTGITNMGRTQWFASPEDSLSVFVDVDTTKNMFAVTPRYYTAIHGRDRHYRAQGAHIVYLANAKGFRIYIVFGDTITPDLANAWQWTISWIGLETDNPKAGRSHDLWAKATNGKGLYMNVDASASHFRVLPSFATAVHATHLHWRVSGAASIYSEKPTGFRLYLDHAMNPVFANKFRWAVDYVGYDGPVDCTLSDWSSAENCSVPCGGGTATITRYLAQHPYNGCAPCPAAPRVGAPGRPPPKECPALVESKACNEGPCVGE
eukprot:g6185.t1